MIALLNELEENNISISLDGNSLKVSFEGENLDAEILNKLKGSKAQLVTYLKKYADSEDFQAIETSNDQEDYPLSPSQYRMWLLSQSDEVALAYNISNKIELKGNYNVQAIISAIESTIRRHDSLRTVFKPDETGTVRQFINTFEATNFKVGFHDLSLETNKTSIAQYIQEDRNKVFDLENAPLIRVHLFKRQEEEYVLYYNMHHIISDGWSMNILVNDFLEYYKAFSENRSADLPRLSIQYKDFASWQNKELQSEKILPLKEFWQKQLSGDIPRIDFPAYKKRPKLKTYNGQNLEFVFPADLTRKFIDYCNKNNSSLFMGLLSVWNILVFRYTGIADVLVGTAVAGREHADLKHIIGCFINTIVIRNLIDVDENFSSVLNKVKENTLTAFDHQNLPFNLIIEEGNFVEDPGRAVLFDSMLLLQNANNSNTDAHVFDRNDIGQIIQKGDRRALCDLDLIFIEKGEHLVFSLTYNIDVYDRETIESLMVHFQNLLQGLLSDPNKNILEIDFLTANERNELLYTLNDTKVDYPENKTVVKLFEEQVDQSIDDIALISGDQQFSYTALNEISNQFADYLLSKHSVKREEVVAILLDKSKQLMIAVLGILKSGAAFLPIDINSPDDWKEYILKDSGCQLVITSDEMNNFLSSKELYTKSNPEVAKLTPDNLAYVMYTSGTSGRPKGVLVEHKSIVRLVKPMDYFPMSADDTILSTGSVSFDATTIEYFGPLLNGGKLVLTKQSNILDLDHLEQIIFQHNVNSLWMTASWFNHVVENKLSLFKNIKQLLVGGDVVSPGHVSKLLNAFPGINISNGYGPTENTTFSAVYPISNQDYQTVPIGKAIPNSTAYILNDKLSLSPKGAVGKLFVGGDGLSRGYLNDEALTKKKFVINPYTHERIYDTGDLARWLPDGHIEFLGRKDSQVKIRGYRIELQEIEHVLLQQAVIKHAVVIIKEENEGKVIVAYLVADTTIDKQLLRDQISQQLPNYMVPGYFKVIEAIPLTKNGKIDRRALPEIADEDLVIEQYIAPTSLKEKVLVEVLTTILKRKKIGIKDNFYNLGGDSIKSIQVVSRLKQKGYLLKVSNLLENPTIEVLAKQLKINKRSINQDEVKGNVHLTPIQKYFFTNPQFKNLSHFNQSILLIAEEEVDPAILKMAFVDLIKHHDALRMTYSQNEEKWVQYNHDTGHRSFDFYSYDLRNESNELGAMTSIGKDLQANFNLDTGPLLKVVLFKLSDKDRVALIAHHLVVDGVSWRVILEDLSQLYLSYKANKKSKLPLKTDSFQYWSAQLQQYAQSKQIEKEYAYWKAVCEKNIPDLIDKSSPLLNGPTAQFGKVEFTIDQHITELLLTKVHHVFNTEINDLLLSALSMAIYEALNVDKVVLKMEGHGREEVINEVDITRTVGWFTSIYPFILEGNRSDLFANVVEVKESLRKIPKKGIGYGIIKYLTDKELKAINPSIVFNYLGDFGSKAGNSDDSIFSFSSENIGKAIDPLNNDNDLLDISGMIVLGELTMSIRYPNHLYQADNMEKLSQAYKKHLERLIQSLADSQEQYKTPFDLTYKGLTIAELARINADNLLEDAYELSPLQKGMYYHWLSSDNTALYFDQAVYRLKLPGLGENVSAIKEAYRALVNRYSILRTSFENEYGGLPLQIVRKSVPTNFSYHPIGDYTSEKDIQEFITEYKSKDKAKGFNLEDPSQMRLLVLGLDNDEFAFIWSHHHILMDGWCMSILINDFYKLLHANLSNNKINLPDPVPYANYIKWLNRKEESASQNYWKDHLAGYSNLVEIPFKYSSPVSNTYSKKVEKIVFKEKFFDGIDAFCSAHEITHNTFVQGVWGVLLAKYNNLKDVVFGSIVSGRPGDLAGVENMVGLFINTIPVRVEYDEQDNSVSLLQKMQLDFIAGNPHHYLEISEVQGLSEVGRDLINHITVFENYAVQDSDEENADNSIEIELAEFSFEEQTNYDFNLKSTPLKNGICVNMEYNSSVHDGDGMRNLAKHFYNLAEQFVVNYDQPIDALNFISKEETQRNVALLNNEKIKYPLDKTIVDIFSEQAVKNPNNIALDFNNETITYKALNEKSNQVARYLLEKGVKEEELIPIFIDRSLEMIIGILGVLKAGAAYVPIDTIFPNDRIKFILNDINARFIITGFPDKDFDCQYALNINEFQFDDYEKSAVNLRITPDQVAYVIYTSGTTGRPKGVLIEHRNVIRLFFNESSLFNFNDTDVWTLFHSFSFDFSVWEIFGALLYGGKLIIVPASTAKDPALFINLLQEKFVTVLNQTPSYFQILQTEILKLQQQNALRYVIFGGDKLITATLKEWHLNYPDCKLINMYGITETTVHVTYKEIGIEEINTPVSNIGKPIPTLGCLVLNENQEVLPVGIPGELYVYGEGVARGYLNRENLTNEKFIYLDILNDKKRYYRSGDLVRLLNNGEIEYIGRIDKQVKIHGYRIELGEIEQLILKQEFIDQVVVDVKKVDDKDAIIAYVKVKVEFDKKELQKILAAKLPQYMLPKYFVNLDVIPLTSNGKINRKALPSVIEEDLIKESFVAPQSFKEKLLVEVFENVLNRKPIGIKDNFFNLGGDSIKSIQVVSKLKQKGYKLKIIDLLKTPIVEELSAKMEINSRIIDQSEVLGNVKLTPIQHYFFYDANVNVLEHYNQSIVLSSRKALQPDILKQSIAQIVKHHDGLRMVYQKNDNYWEQQNQSYSDESYEFHSYDLRDQVDELEEMNALAQKLQAGMDLTNGPLFKVAHFKLKEGDKVALIAHHLVIDGVSWRIIMEDLSNLYTSYAINKTYKLPLKTDSFQYWSNQLTEYAHKNELEYEIFYWKELCNAYIPPLYGNKTIRSKNETNDYGMVNFTLDEKNTEALLTGIHDFHKIEIKHALLTALGISLKDVFNVSKSVLKMEGHGREDIMEDVDIARTVGWFTTIFPHVLNIEHERNIDNLIAVKASLDSIPKKGIGYGILKYLKKIPVQEIETSIVFNYLGDFGANSGQEESSMFSISNEKIGDASSALNDVDHHLNINGLIIENKLSMSIRFPKYLYEEEAVNKLSKAYKQTLIDLVETLSSMDSKLLKTQNVSEPIEISGNQAHIIKNTRGHGRFGPVFIPDFDIKNFEAKFRKFLHLFPVLCTSFSKDPKTGAITQTYLTPDEIKLNIRREERFEESKIKVLEEKVHEFFNTPYIFYGENIELFRLYIVQKESDKDASLFMAIHHAITDMYSNDIIKNSLSNFFSGETKEINYPSNLEFAKWQKTFLNSATGKKQRQFWLSYLDKIPKHTALNKNNTNTTSISQKIFITESLKDKFLEKVKQSDLPLSASLMAEHQKLIRCLALESRYLQMILVNGREQEIENLDVKKIVGSINNVLPLVVLSAKDSSSEINPLSTYNEYLELRMNQQIPFEIIRTAFLEKRNIDIENCIAGEFNFQKKENFEISYDSANKVLVNENKNDYREGVNFKGIIYKNAIMLELTCPIELYEQGKEAISLQRFINHLIK